MSGSVTEPALVRARLRGGDRWEQSGSELLYVRVYPWAVGHCRVYGKGI